MDFCGKLEDNSSRRESVVDQQIVMPDGTGEDDLRRDREGSPNEVRMSDLDR